MFFHCQKKGNKKEQMGWSAWSISKHGESRSEGSRGECWPAAAFLRRRRLRTAAQMLYSIPSTGTVHLQICILQTAEANRSLLCTESLFVAGLIKNNRCAWCASSRAHQVMVHTVSQLWGETQKHGTSQNMHQNLSAALGTWLISSGEACPQILSVPGKCRKGW